MDKSRIEIFEETIKNSPTDSFAHYALAMEYEKAGRLDDALALYRKIIGFDPDYVPAYQMGGQLFMRLSRIDEAREILVRGLTAAQKTTNHRAAEEIQGLLDELR